jgi:hypothetical protein
VRGLECAEDCIEVLAVIWSPIRIPNEARCTKLIQTVSVAAGALAHDIFLL